MTQAYTQAVDTHLYNVYSIYYAEHFVYYCFTEDISLWGIHGFNPTQLDWPGGECLTRESNPSRQVRKKKLSAELANGRLAMMAIIGTWAGAEPAVRRKAGSDFERECEQDWFNKMNSCKQKNVVIQKSFNKNVLPNMEKETDAITASCNQSRIVWTVPFAEMHGKDPQGQEMGSTGKVFRLVTENMVDKSIGCSLLSLGLTDKC